MISSNSSCAEIPAEESVPKLKILHTVESYTPLINGMSEVVRQLSERLVAAGHEVTVATGVAPERAGTDLRGVRVVEFAVSGNAVSGFCGDADSYERFLLDSSFDVITNFAAQQWATDLVLPLLPKIAGRKVFVPTGFSGLHSRRFREYYRKMPQYMNHYDMNVFLSDHYRDVSFARHHGITRQMLIPNGAAAGEFLAPFSDVRLQLGIPAGHFLILHVGSHTWLKGHEEAMEIFSRADIPHATLLMVGNEPSGGCGALCNGRADRLNATAGFRADDRRIVVTELSRRDTVAAYQTADMFLFPSNIECSPIVLFECMASRTPFLVTDVGNSAEIIAWSGGAGLLLPSDPPTFLPRYGNLLGRCREKVRMMLGQSADLAAVRANISGSAALLTTLYRDLAGREKMAHDGFLSWQKSFTWEAIAAEYEKLYRNLTGGKL
jgi:glycosyltransferase involved in cell wall biosynthesis